MAVVSLCCVCSVAAAQNTTSPSASDKKFVRGALEDGDAEVQLGQLAVQKAHSEDVKQLGQKMIDDHTRMGEQMRDVAQKEGIKAPAGKDAKDKDLEKKLRKLSGESFDKAYIAAMVKDHRQDLAEYKKEAESGNDTAIKDAASKETQEISEDLKMAEEIARSHKVATGKGGH